MQQAIDYLSNISGMHVLMIGVFIELCIANIYLRKIWQEVEYNNLEDDYDSMPDPVITKMYKPN
jgi:hypothetical protein